MAVNYEEKSFMEWDETHNLKVVGLKPSTVYWMDIYLSQCLM